VLAAMQGVEISVVCVAFVSPLAPVVHRGTCAEMLTPAFSGTGDGEVRRQPLPPLGESEVHLEPFSITLELRVELYKSL
jgi:hypothetical protein